MPETEIEKEEKKIKKGLNIYWYYWTFLFFIGFVVLNEYNSFIKMDFVNLSLMISVVSFLFGFLISIIFSMLLTKVAKLKEALASETGRIISLYNLSKYLGERFHNALKERIDSYTIKTLRYYTQYETSREINYGIYKDLNLAETKTDIQKYSLGSFLYIFGEFQIIRENLEYLTSRRIEWSLKLTNYILGILLIVLLFFNRAEGFSGVLFIILSTTIVFIFLIIEDYDDLRIGDYTINISNSEQIFDMLGKDRYYPEYLLKRTNLEKGRKYRVGIFDSKLKQEKIVTITYSPNSKFRLNNLISKIKRKK